MEGTEHLGQIMIRQNCMEERQRENPTPPPLTFSSGRTNRYEREEDNEGQTNESVRDIMNSHALMRPIYCRGEDEEWLHTTKHKYTNTHIKQHT